MFRSVSPDWNLAAGQRVVVRRKAGNHHTDVIGHVVSVSEDHVVLRPQKVGGFPSSAPEIVIARDDIAVVRKLSPRTVRNSQIRDIERAYAKAFPGLEHTWCGQWLLRAGDGITERSNSAAPLGSAALFSPVPLEEITQFYREHNLVPQLLIPERIARPAQKLAQSQDWELGPEIIVMTRDLADIPAPKTTLRFQLDATPSKHWLDLYHFRGQALPARALELLCAEIDGQMGFGALCDDAGQIVAITRGTITEAGGEQYLGYSAVEVAPAWRRRGLGTDLGIHMLGWGQALGADYAYLHVLESNHAGIGLYQKLGFVEHHRHRYATIAHNAH
ncbi:GNAT family N-acetyltransferase [Corynebacterium sp. sy017]|uniref:N-acetylglutamate synthase, CG3035 family n=1 Tax=unclassified Corynebacterium TaxID=2624378 RepID=UPI001184B98F|nr:MULTISPECIES: GNAT family N-acetyltransferase [unclassified Corynebacterium]MBP3088448.1 GNAT family N-acetyltransferase [Corynebacterium sp. sy017]TSD91757.1 GNAT family N-acetyltransferase [Corynebacterium sp. SY003]